MYRYRDVGGTTSGCGNWCQWYDELYENITTQPSLSTNHDGLSEYIKAHPSPLDISVASKHQQSNIHRGSCLLLVIMNTSLVLIVCCIIGYAAAAGLSKKEQQKILNQHNEFRASIKASDMVKLVSLRTLLHNWELHFWCPMFNNVQLWFSNVLRSTF